MADNKGTASADLFDGAKQSSTGRKSAPGSGGDGTFTDEQLQAAAASVSRTLVAPGQMAVDEARGYYAKIKNKFPGGSEVEFDLALFAWGCTQGTGASTDYASAEPLIVGGVSVPAVAFAGGIVPVDDRGLLRKFFSTTYEEKARRYMGALPALQVKMRARAAKAGDVGGDPFNHIDFVRGVGVSSGGSAGIRVAVKDRLLARRGDQSFAPRDPAVDLGGERSGSGGLFG